MRFRNIAPLLCGAALLACSEARAQYGVTGVGMAGGPGFGSSPYAAPAYGAWEYPASGVVPGMASSYYAPRPRDYVGYGSADFFPYYGRYYGRPYDAWTWPYMSGAYQAGLARYYYPPLR